MFQPKGSIFVLFWVPGKPGYGCLKEFFKKKIQTFQRKINYVFQHLRKKILFQKKSNLFQLEFFFDKMKTKFPKTLNIIKKVFLFGT